MEAYRKISRTIFKLNFRIYLFRSSCCSFRKKYDIQFSRKKKEKEKSKERKEGRKQKTAYKKVESNVKKMCNSFYSLFFNKFI